MHRTKAASFHKVTNKILKPFFFYFDALAGKGLDCWWPVFSVRVHPVFVSQRNCWVRDEKGLERDTNSFECWIKVSSQFHSS